MSSTEFEFSIPKIERPHTNALDRTATEIDLRKGNTELWITSVYQKLIQAGNTAYIWDTIVHIWLWSKPEWKKSPGRPVRCRNQEIRQNGNHNECTILMTTIRVYVIPPGGCTKASTRFTLNILRMGLSCFQHNAALLLYRCKQTCRTLYSWHIKNKRAVLLSWCTVEISGEVW
jgi:hypothetical protein